jgi:hypothetical protein
MYVYDCGIGDKQPQRHSGARSEFRGDRQRAAAAAADAAAAAAAGVDCTSATDVMFRLHHERFTTNNWF